MAYPWPGNVRQLENAIERAVALSGGRTQIETADLTPEIQQASQAAAAPDVNLPEGGIDFERYINRIEHELIRRALEKTGGNKGQASRLLNLKRTTLVEKLKRFETSVRCCTSSSSVRSRESRTSDRAAMFAALECCRDRDSDRAALSRRRARHAWRRVRKADAQDFPFAAVIEFDDLAGLQAYLRHPTHEQLGELFYKLQEARWRTTTR